MDKQQTSTGEATARAAAALAAATTKARKALGKNAVIEDRGRKFAASERQRQQWRDELARLRAESPGMWTRQQMQVRDRLLARRYVVGVRESIGGLGYLDVRGMGDTLAEALAAAGVAQ